MDFETLIYQYFHRQLDQREVYLEKFNSGSKLLDYDILDCLDYIVAYTEHDLLEKVYRDIKIIYGISKEGKKEC